MPETSLLPRLAALRPRTVVMVLLALTAAVYSGTASYNFVFDDEWQIQRNPLVHDWSNLPKYFTGHVWQQITPANGAYYRPAFLLWLRLNYALFGENPAGWHVANVLLHLLVVLLVYLVARRLMPDAAALVATAIFALHPTHIESVAWISGSPDLLLGAFLCGMVLAYARWLERRRASDFVVALLMAAGALLSKEPAVLLPLILVAYHLLASKATVPLREAVGSVAAFTFLTVLYLAARYAAIGGMGFLPTQASWLEVALTAPVILAFYLKQLIWPFGLSLFYDLAKVSSPASLSFIVAALLALALLAALILWARADRRVWFALAFLALLAPVFYIRVFIPGELVHDRYLYVPSIGFALLLGIGFEWLRQRTRAGSTRAVLPAAATAVAAVLAVATAMQHVHWANEIALFSQAAQRSQDHPLAWVNLGVAFSNASVRDPAMFGHAHNAYQRALQLDPHNWKIQYNMGYLLYRMNRFAEAEPYLRRGAVDRSLNLPWVYWGFTLFHLQRWQESEHALRTALEIEPRATGLRVPMAVAMANQGKVKEAVAELHAELKLNPNDAAARAHLQRLTAEHRPTEPLR